MSNKFYEFKQNNSGGSFAHDAKAGIGYTVIIEAASHEEANKRAESIGIYFDGCNTGQDCECCGDRWYAAWGRDGDKEPSMYGKPVAEAANGDFGWWGYPVYVHYLNGTVAAYRHERERDGAPLMTIVREAA